MIREAVRVKMLIEAALAEMLFNLETAVERFELAVADRPSS